MSVALGQVICLVSSAAVNQLPVQVASWKVLVIFHRTPFCLPLKCEKEIILSNSTQEFGMMKNLFFKVDNH